MLQGHFYHPERPAYLNYGAIGSIIAHEITHAFDNRGSEYDANGNFRSWWNLETKKSFSIRSQCFIEQYESIMDSQINVTLNGKSTLSENIADNGAIKTAYKAYQYYKLRQSKDDQYLPGLEKFSSNQMYWIKSAQNWCSKLSIDILMEHIKFRSHTIEKYRVVVPIQNSEQFSKDFKCTKGSQMNPEKKCNLW